MDRGYRTLLSAASMNPVLLLELLDFFNGGARYSYNSGATALRERLAARPVGRLVLVCTGAVMEAQARIEAAIRADYPGVRVDFVPLACQDIACQQDDEDMRRQVYAAVARHAGPHLVISSAGRKTITQRIIEASLLHGCAGYLSITVPHGKEADPGVRGMTRDFNVLFVPARRFTEERRHALVQDELGDTFRSVYLMPRMVIARLRQERIGTLREREAADLAWLERLPKADLHCHLGGCQDEALLQELGESLLDDLERGGARRGELRQRLEGALGHALEDLTPKRLRALVPEKRLCHCLRALPRLWDLAGAASGRDRALAAALLVTALDRQALQDLCQDGGSGPDGRTRWPDEDSLPQGSNRLDWYMARGDLGGSTLLQSKSTLERAVSRLIQDSARENVRYLEIRCSPDNYTRAGLLDINTAMTTLLEAARSHDAVARGAIRVNFLVMATRHRSRSLLERHVALALLHGTGVQDGPRVCGFDLAGQEEHYRPMEFRDSFFPLHRACMNITIHAGEMDEEQAIWEAIYLLHAKRIGHGLRLRDNQRMMDFVRDHDLCIEMCPSSNCQTNTFHDFSRSPEPGTRPCYPLRAYLRHGIRVTVNTDNRFISETSASRELLRAAWLTRGGLSRWEVLKLVKNGFKGAFLPKNERDRLLKDVDAQVFSLLLEDAFEPHWSREEGA